MAKVNMTGQTQALVTLDPGKYIAEIVGWEFGFSSNGNEMLTVIIECAKNQAGTGPKGRIYDRLVFTPNAAWKVEQFIDCFAASGGLPVAIGDDVDINDGVMERILMNAKGGVVVASDTYEGKTRATIETYVPSKDSGVFQKGSSERIFTRSQKESQPAALPEAGPAGTTHSLATEMEEDDIPF